MTSSPEATARPRTESQLPPLSFVEWLKEHRTQVRRVTYATVTLQFASVLAKQVAPALHLSLTEHRALILIFGAHLLGMLLLAIWLPSMRDEFQGKRFVGKRLRKAQFQLVAIWQTTWLLWIALYSIFFISEISKLPSVRMRTGPVSIVPEDVKSPYRLIESLTSDSKNPFRYVSSPNPRLASAIDAYEQIPEDVIRKHAANMLNEIVAGVAEDREVRNGYQDDFYAPFADIRVLRDPKKGIKPDHELAFLESTLRDQNKLERATTIPYRWLRHCLYIRYNFNSALVERMLKELDASTLPDERKRLTIEYLHRIFPDYLGYSTFVPLTLASDGLNNSVTVLLLLAMVALSPVSSTRRGRVLAGLAVQRRRRLQVFDGLFISAVLAGIEAFALWCLPQFRLSPESVIIASRFAGGLAACMAMAILISRLDSESIGTPKWAIWILYAYASIQPAYASFDAVPFIEAVVMPLAFIGKILLFLLLVWMIDQSILVYHFDWMERNRSLPFPSLQDWVRKKRKISLLSQQQVSEHLREIVSMLTQPQGAMEERLSEYIDENCRKRWLEFLSATDFNLEANNHLEEIWSSVNNMILNPQLAVRALGGARQEEDLSTEEVVRINRALFWVALEDCRRRQEELTPV